VLSQSCLSGIVVWSVWSSPSSKNIPILAGRHSNLSCVQNAWWLLP